MDVRDRYVLLVTEMARSLRTPAWSGTRTPKIVWEAMCVSPECLKPERLYAQAWEHAYSFALRVDRPEWLWFETEPWEGQEVLVPTGKAGG